MNMAGCRSKVKVLTMVSRRCRRGGRGWRRRAGGRRWGWWSFKRATPWECGRNSVEFWVALEVRRGGRQEVLVRGRRCGRRGCRVSAFCLLSKGGPAGEGRQNINKQTKTSRLRAAI